jgi:hypothetical protein
MKRRGTGVAVMALVLALCLAACSRSQGAQSAAVVTGAMARPAAQQQIQPQQARQSSLPTAPAPQAPTAAQPQTIPGKVVASDRTQEFTVAQRKYRLLIHEQSIDGTTEKTVEWWELLDADDHVVRRETYPVTIQNGAFENITEISGNSFEAKGGSGIIISGMDLPSAPDSGGWMQVFAFKYGRDKYGADPSLFVAFGPPIYVTGDFLGVVTDSYQPTPLFKGATPQTIIYDILKFSVWTGNFKIAYPVRINWITGHLEPAWKCIETTSQGRVERCSYPVSAEAHREDQPTFVRLFPESDDGFTPKHVIIQPQSKIEFLEARVPMAWSEDEKSITFGANGDMWLKVRIDGVEGWIHSEEDFEAVGLPQAG